MQKVRNSMITKHASNKNTSLHGSTFRSSKINQSHSVCKHLLATMAVHYLLDPDGNILTDPDGNPLYAGDGNV